MTTPPIPPETDFAGRRVLVTGGMGFIGSNLALRLAAAGADVVVLDNQTPDSGANPANLAGADIPVERVDLGDLGALKALVTGQDVIFNLAAQISHMDSMARPLNDLAINAAGPLTLLEAVRERAPAAIIVHASTRQFYGKPDYLPVDEAHPTRPTDVNGINKLAGESFMSLYHRVHGLGTVSLRLTNTYGPRMRIRDARQTFIGIWLRRVIEGAPFEVWDGATLRDLTYVDDAVDAFLLAASRPAAIGQVFNIGGPPPVSLDDLARLLVEVAGGGRFDQRAFPAERKRIDIGDYYADDRRFRLATGWAPRVGLAEGLRRSLEFYRARMGDYC